MDVNNVAVKSQHDATPSELDVTGQTLPPKPKCKLLWNTAESYGNE